MIAEGRQRVAGCALLALVAVFFVPAGGAVVLADAAKHGWVPAGLAQSWLWQDFILPHQVWAILTMAVVLVWIRARTELKPLVN
jgi:ABC-type thiamine transport system ATPase subunit